MRRIGLLILFVVLATRIYASSGNYINIVGEEPTNNINTFHSGDGGVNIITPPNTFTSAVDTEYITYMPINTAIVVIAGANLTNIFPRNLISSESFIDLIYTEESNRYNYNLRSEVLRDILVNNPRYRYRIIIHVSTNNHGMPVTEILLRKFGEITDEAIETLVTFTNYFSRQDPKGAENLNSLGFLEVETFDMLENDTEESDDDILINI